MCGCLSCIVYLNGVKLNSPWLLMPIKFGALHMFKTQLFLNALIVINIVKFVQVIMRWRVQLGNNSTSDVWTFCQNWMSRRTCLLLALQHWILLNVNIIFCRQSPVLSGAFCSYFHLVLLLKRNLVILFVFSSSFSREISFHICV